MKIKLSELKQLIAEELNSNRYERVEVWQLMGYVNPSYMTVCGMYFTESDAKRVATFLNQVPNAEGRKYKYERNIDSILVTQIELAKKAGINVKIIKRD
jgi:hypothetical protein